FYGSIADILVDAGHDVTTLLPEIDPSWSDGTLKSKKIHVELSPESRKVAQKLKSGAASWFLRDNFEFVGPFFRGTPYADQFAIHCRGVLEKTALIEKLREEKFDVMIT
ncbi:hypothetical protein PFISCL1PPCAC_6957, partial [Pristionchus fissidentatus]